MIKLIPSDLTVDTYTRLTEEKLTNIYYAFRYDTKPPLNLYRLTDILHEFIIPTSRHDGGVEYSTVDVQPTN